MTCVSNWVFPTSFDEDFPVSANLIIRPEKLGDLVVATPVFRAFKESYPNHPVHLLTDDIFADSVRHDPHLDKIITISWQGRLRGQRPSLLKIRSHLTSIKYEKAAILYSGWSGWNWLCASLSIPHVVQVGGTKAALLLGHKMVLRGRRYTERHMGDWYLDVAREFGAETRTKEPKIYLTEKEIEVFKNRFPDYAEEAANSIILHLSGSPVGENVSLEKFAEWIPELLSTFKKRIYLTGTVREKLAWSRSNGNLGNQELLGNLTIREMMVAVSLAGSLICNSTGIVHVSAALGTPTLGIYTPDRANSAKVWGPIGKKTICIEPGFEDFQKMKSILPVGQRVDLGSILSIEKVIKSLGDLGKLGSGNGSV